MKHRRNALLLVALVGASLPGCGGTGPRDDSGPEPLPPQQAIAPVDLTPFRDALEPYGDWTETREYGTVWVPYATPAGWRPYTTGRWLLTNHGWMWMEEEPWGWAAFHYGRWAPDERLGWLWVPGNTWAPSWVAWRYGQGYVGWAPLSPEVDWKRASASNRPDALERDIDLFAWSFVRARDFGSRSIASQVAPVGRNPTLRSLTGGAGRYAAAGTRVAERGFSESGAVELPRRYRVVDATAHRQNRAPIVQGSTVQVYRPEALKSRAPQSSSSLSQRSSLGRVQDMAERERREQERFEENLARERERLLQEQERERRQRPESVSKDRLRKRQKTETEAQESFERRERSLLEARRERLREGAGQG
jgi:hypothetical protein